MTTPLALSGPNPADTAPTPTDSAAPEDGQDVFLPVFNPLAHDGARCDACQKRPQVYYVASYERSGANRPNRFVCAACFPAVQEAILQKRGSMTVFRVAMPGTFARQLTLSEEENPPLQSGEGKPEPPCARGVRR